MPIDEFQILVFSIIGKNRDPNSYVAGGVAINAASSSPRFSADIDLFHASAEAVQRSFALDRAVLEAAGFLVDVNVNQPGFITAVISKAGSTLKLDWANDSAFRYFPIERDRVMGCRLHAVDLATNKCLALAGRSEVRDIIDAIHLNESTMSLACMIWAACGKDPGFTPDMIVSQLRRNARISPDSLAIERTVRPVDAVQLKKDWLTLIEKAETELLTFPTQDLGCVYTDQEGKLVGWPETFDELRPHFGSVGGAWPVARTN
jgi:hypothetical protein